MANDRFHYTIIEEEDDRIVVEFTKLEVEEINLLRRHFYKKIEVLKCSYFYIREHKSNYDDTVLCDRLSLLALKHRDPIETYSAEYPSSSAKKEKEELEEAPPKLDDPASRAGLPGIRFELIKEGPGVVFASDLQLFLEEKAEPVKKVRGKKQSPPKRVAPIVEVIHPQTPIIQLYSNQRINLSAFVVRGTHGLNASFSPGSCTLYEENGGRLRFVVESYGQYTPIELLTRLIGFESKIVE